MKKEKENGAKRYRGVRKSKERFYWVGRGLISYSSMKKGVSTSYREILSCFSRDKVGFEMVWASPLLSPPHSSPSPRHVVLGHFLNQAFYSSYFSDTIVRYSLEDSFHIKAWL